MLRGLWADAAFAVLHALSAVVAAMRNRNWFNKLWGVGGGGPGGTRGGRAPQTTLSTLSRQATMHNLTRWWHQRVNS